MMIKKKYLILVGICIILIGIGFLIFHLTRSENSFEEYYNEKVQLFNKENKTATKNEYVFLGDSITDGYDLQYYYPEIIAYNRGIGGDTTSGLLNRLQSSVYDLEPNELIILIGINDLFSGKTVEEVIRNYKIILTSITNRLPQTNITVLSVYPIDVTNFPQFEDIPQKIISLNSFLEIEVESFGKVKYLNIYDHLVQNQQLKNQYSVDGLHLSPEGYELVTTLIKQEII